MLGRRVMAKVIGFFVIVALLASLGPMLTPRRGVDLGNGYRVELLKVDLGRLVYNSDTEAQAVFRDLGPAAITKRMDQPIEFQMVSNQDQGSLFLLFQFWPTVPRADIRQARWVPRLEFVESSGFVYSQPTETQTPYEVGRSDYSVLARAHVYPRRDPMLHYRLCDPQTGQVLYEQSIPNPAYQSQIAEWTPQELPITQTVVGKTLTLKSVTLNTKEQEIVAEFSPPKWRIGDYEHPWVPHFSDATGNVAKWLSPHEPAWKVSVGVHRTASDFFLPEEMLRISSVSLPGPKSSTELTGEKAYDEVVVRPRFLLGVGKYRIQNGQLTEQTQFDPGEPMNPTGVIRFGDPQSNSSNMVIHSRTPALWVEHSDVPWTDPMIVICRDQFGRDLQAQYQTAATLTAADTTYRWISIQPFSDSTSCDVEFIWNIKPLYFEFFIKPPVAGEAK